jgi:hypothetical protein
MNAFRRLGLRGNQRRPPLYILDGEHWRIRGVSELSRFFSAMTALAPPSALLALGDGAWTTEVVERLRGMSVPTTAVDPPPYVTEFRTWFAVPVTTNNMESLAMLSETRAEIEVALHVLLFTRGRPLLDWFDLPQDPMELSTKLDEAAVFAFNDAVGGVIDLVKAGV